MTQGLPSSSSHLRASGSTTANDRQNSWSKNKITTLARDYWMGTEIGMLGGYGFQGQVTAGDGSDKQSKMGVGYNKLEK